MSYFLYFLLPEKKQNPALSYAQTKKGNFYDETMAADNEKEEEIEDEEVRFS